MGVNHSFLSDPEQCSPWLSVENPHRFKSESTIGAADEGKTLLHKIRHFSDVESTNLWKCYTAACAEACSSHKAALTARASGIPIPKRQMLVAEAFENEKRLSNNTLEREGSSSIRTPSPQQQQQLSQPSQQHTHFQYEGINGAELYGEFSVNEEYQAAMERTRNLGVSGGGGSKRSGAQIFKSSVQSIIDDCVMQYVHLGCDVAQLKSAVSVGTRGGVLPGDGESSITSSLLTFNPQASLLSPLMAVDVNSPTDATDKDAPSPQSGPTYTPECGRRNFNNLREVQSFSANAKAWITHGLLFYHVFAKGVCSSNNATNSINNNVIEYNSLVKCLKNERKATKQLLGLCLPDVYTPIVHESSYLGQHVLVVPLCPIPSVAFSRESCVAPHSSTHSTSSSSSIVLRRINNLSAMISDALGYNCSASSNSCRSVFCSVGMDDRVYFIGNQPWFEFLNPAAACVESSITPQETVPHASSVGSNFDRHAEMDFSHSYSLCLSTAEQHLLLGGDDYVSVNDHVVPHAVRHGVSTLAKQLCVEFPHSVSTATLKQVLHEHGLKQSHCHVLYAKLVELKCLGHSVVPTAVQDTLISRIICRAARDYVQHCWVMLSQSLPPAATSSSSGGGALKPYAAIATKVIHAFNMFKNTRGRVSGELVMSSSPSGKKDLPQNTVVEEIEREFFEIVCRNLGLPIREQQHATAPQEDSVCTPHGTAPSSQPCNPFNASSLLVTDSLWRQIVHDFCGMLNVEVITNLGAMNDGWGGLLVSRIRALTKASFPPLYEGFRKPKTHLQQLHQDEGGRKAVGGQTTPPIAKKVITSAGGGDSNSSTPSHRILAISGHHGNNSSASHHTSRPLDVANPPKQQFTDRFVNQVLRNRGALNCCSPSFKEAFHNILSHSRSNSPSHVADGDDGRAVPPAVSARSQSFNNSQLTAAASCIALSGRQGTPGSSSCAAWLLRSFGGSRDTEDGQETCNLTPQNCPWWHRVMAQLIRTHWLNSFSKSDASVAPNVTPAKSSTKSAVSTTLPPLPDINDVIAHYEFCVLRSKLMPAVETGIRVHLESLLVSRGQVTDHNHKNSGDDEDGAYYPQSVTEQAAVLGAYLQLRTAANKRSKTGGANTNTILQQPISSFTASFVPNSIRLLCEVLVPNVVRRNNGSGAENSTSLRSTTGNDIASPFPLASAVASGQGIIMKLIVSYISDPSAPSLDTALHFLQQYLSVTAAYYGEHSLEVLNDVNDCVAVILTLSNNKGLRENELLKIAHTLLPTFDSHIQDMLSDKPALPIARNNASYLLLKLADYQPDDNKRLKFQMLHDALDHAQNARASAVRLRQNFLAADALNNQASIEAKLGFLKKAETNFKIAASEFSMLIPQQTEQYMRAEHNAKVVGAQRLVRGITAVQIKIRCFLRKLEKKRQEASMMNTPAALSVQAHERNERAAIKLKEGMERNENLHPIELYRRIGHSSFNIICCKEFVSCSGNSYEEYCDLQVGLFTAEAHNELSTKQTEVEGVIAANVAILSAQMQSIVHHAERSKLQIADGEQDARVLLSQNEISGRNSTANSRATSPDRQHTQEQQQVVEAEQQHQRQRQVVEAEEQQQQVVDAEEQQQQQQVVDAEEQQQQQQQQQVVEAEQQHQRQVVEAEEQQQQVADADEQQQQQQVVEAEQQQQQVVVAVQQQQRQVVEAEEQQQQVVDADEQQQQQQVVDAEQQQQQVVVAVQQQQQQQQVVDAEQQHQQQQQVVVAEQQHQQQQQQQQVVEAVQQKQQVVEAEQQQQQQQVVDADEQQQQQQVFDAEQHQHQQQQQQLVVEAVQQQQQQQQVVVAEQQQQQVVEAEQQQQQQQQQVVEAEQQQQQQQQQVVEAVQQQQQQVVVVVQQQQQQQQQQVVETEEQQQQVVEAEQQQQQQVVEAEQQQQQQVVETEEQQQQVVETEEQQQQVVEAEQQQQRIAERREAHELQASEGVSRLVIEMLEAVDAEKTFRALLQAKERNYVVLGMMIPALQLVEPLVRRATMEHEAEGWSSLSKNASRNLQQHTAAGLLETEEVKERSKLAFDELCEVHLLAMDLFDFEWYEQLKVIQQQAVRSYIAAATTVELQLVEVAEFDRRLSIERVGLQALETEARHMLSRFAELCRLGLKITLDVEVKDQTVREARERQDLEDVAASYMEECNARIVISCLEQEEFLLVVLKQSVSANERFERATILSEFKLESGILSAMAATMIYERDTRLLLCRNFVILLECQYREFLHEHQGLIATSLLLDFKSRAQTIIAVDDVTVEEQSMRVRIKIAELDEVHELTRNILEMLLRTKGSEFLANEATTLFDQLRLECAEEQCRLGIASDEGTEKAIIDLEVQESWKEVVRKKSVEEQEQLEVERNTKENYSFIAHQEKLTRNELGQSFLAATEALVRSLTVRSYVDRLRAICFEAEEITMPMVMVQSECAMVRRATRRQELEGCETIHRAFFVQAEIIVRRILQIEWDIEIAEDTEGEFDIHALLDVSSRFASPPKAECVEKEMENRSAVVPTSDASLMAESSLLGTSLMMLNKRSIAKPKKYRKGLYEVAVQHPVILSDSNVQYVLISDLESRNERPRKYVAHLLSARVAAAPSVEQQEALTRISVAQSEQNVWDEVIDYFLTEGRLVVLSRGHTRVGGVMAKICKTPQIFMQSSTHHRQQQQTSNNPQAASQRSLMLQGVKWAVDIWDGHRLPGTIAAALITLERESDEEVRSLRLRERQGYDIMMQLFTEQGELVQFAERRRRKTLATAISIEDSKKICYSENYNRQALIAEYDDCNAPNPLPLRPMLHFPSMEPMLLSFTTHSAFGGDANLEETSSRA